MDDSYDEVVQLDHRRNVGPDASRDHAAIHEQLTARRDEAAKRAEQAGQERDAAERKQSQWEDERDRYDALLASLGTPRDTP